MSGEETNAHKYRLRVTAGPEYEPSNHQVVPVNGETIRIESDHAIISLCVRIQDYTGKYPLLCSRASPNSSRLPRRLGINKPILRTPTTHKRSILNMLFNNLQRERKRQQPSLRQ